MAFSVVAHTAAVTGILNTPVTTSAIDTSGANLLVSVVSTVGTPGLTDNKSNTWTPLTSRSNSFRKMQMFYSYAPTVGSGHTFTTTAGFADSIAVIALSGSDSSPFDVENSNTAANTTDPITTGSITPTQDNEIAIAAVVTPDSGSDSIDGGFTISDQVAGVPATAQGVALAYLVQTSAAAANPTWTPSGGSGSNGLALISAFKSAVVTSSRPNRLPLLGVS